MGIFAFVKVTSFTGDFVVDLEDSQRVVNAKLGSEVELICPTNAQSKPICIWTDPENEKIELIGK